MTVMKNSENVYALRQEYHKFSRSWHPAIFYWNHNGTDSWVEGLVYDAGGFCYEPTENYLQFSRPGTDRCKPEEVARVVEMYLEACARDGQPAQREVKRLGAYRPEIRA